MRLRIDIEIPNYTRWIAVGLILGLGLGYGVSAVHADTVAVDTWDAGELLSAEKLNKNLADLQSAINALSSGDCPRGYSRKSTSTNVVLCVNGVDQVVKVGTGGSAFWIDRYEASVWAHSDGTGQQYGIPNAAYYPSTFPPNGQYSASSPLYALSVPQVLPSTSLTWFQALAACSASGKRLPTKSEWLLAAKGTVDPGPNDGTDGSCVTAAAKPRVAGLGATRCVSDWGAEDMVGNFWEFTDEWRMSPGDSLWNTWPDGVFNSDYTINVGSRARTNASEGYGLPAAEQHGGAWADGEKTGLFAIDILSSADYQQNTIGFRCVVPR